MRGRIRYNFAREDRWAMIKKKVRVIIWVMEKIREEHCRVSEGMDVHIGQSVTPWKLAALEQWSWSGGRMGDNELREEKSLLILVFFLLWKDTVTRSPEKEKWGSFQSGKGSTGAVTCVTGRGPGTEQVLNTSLLQKRPPPHTSQNPQFYLAESWDIKMVRST